MTGNTSLCSALLLALGLVASQACPSYQVFPDCRISCDFDWNVIPPDGEFTYQCQGVPVNASRRSWDLSQNHDDSAGAHLKATVNDHKVWEANLEPDDPPIHVDYTGAAPEAGTWEFKLSNRDWLVWRHCRVHLNVTIGVAAAVEEQQLPAATLLRGGGR